jgi:uncharacterized protein YheU (UPF0270 family)
MIIPIDQLESETLTSIIEQFVLREGTDYGENTYKLDQKVAHVRSQLEKDLAVLVYSELNESVDILTRRDYEKMLARENENNGDM